MFELQTTEVNNNMYRYVEEIPVKRLFAESLVDLLNTKCSDSSVSKKINILNKERYPLVYVLGKPPVKDKRKWGTLVQKKLPYYIESASVNLVLRLVCSRYHRPYMYVEDNDNPLKFI